MIKKFFPAVLSLCLILSSTIFAEEPTPPDPPSDSQSTSQPQFHSNDERKNEFDRGMREKRTDGENSPPDKRNIENGENPNPPRQSDENFTDNQDGAGNFPEQNNRPDFQNGKDMKEDSAKKTEKNEENIDLTENQETQKTVLSLIREYSSPISAIILLALGFVFVIFYKRKTF